MRIVIFNLFHCNALEEFERNLHIEIKVEKEHAEEEVLNRDIFEVTQYKPFFENSVNEEFEDFIYLISRGKFEEVIEEAERLELKVD